MRVLKLFLKGRIRSVLALMIFVTWIVLSDPRALLSSRANPGPCHCGAVCGEQEGKPISPQHNTTLPPTPSTMPPQTTHPTLKTTTTPLESSRDFPLKPHHLHITHTLVKGKYLTIGVPSMYRNSTGNAYLKQTLRSLVRHIEPTERSQVTILIFLTDWDPHMHAETKRYIEKEYAEHLQSGFLAVMEVDQSAYPPLSHLKRNYNDAPERVRWRSKQVVDFAFMFYTGRTLSRYYMQIEDDVISSMHVVAKIRKQISTFSKPWTTLEFSSLGFIGKLYKSEDLERFAKFLLMFYAEQPVDWLYDYFFRLLTQKKRIVLQPALFQHFGLHTSFTETDSRKKKFLNTLREKQFADPDPRDLAEVVLPQDQAKTIAKQVKASADQGVQIMAKKVMWIAQHEQRRNAQLTPNPPATLSTSFQTYGRHSPEYAYDDNPSTFFWGMEVLANSTFTIVFTWEVRLTSVQIRSGLDHHPTDIIEDALLEYSDNTHNPDVRDNPQICAGDSYRVLGEFKDGTMTAVSLDLPRVKCLQIRFLKPLEQWIIIDSIRINNYDSYLLD